MGLAGAAVLVAARVLDRPTLPPGTNFRFLDARSAGVVHALVPVVLAGTLPVAGDERDAAVREVVEAFDRAVSGLSPTVQKEMDDLFSLLRYAPTRIVFTGVYASWESASAESIARFLSHWRESRFDLLRAGYQALTQLMQAAWYGNPKSWSAIGYPGPPTAGIST